jgi:rhodanese-related sulfurtransferase
MIVAGGVGEILAGGGATVLLLVGATDCFTATYSLKKTIVRVVCNEPGRSASACSMLSSSSSFTAVSCTCASTEFVEGISSWADLTLQESFKLF